MFIGASSARESLWLSWYENVFGSKIAAQHTEIDTKMPLINPLAPFYTQPCPCHSGQTLANCCGPYLVGEKTAPTAETLMRSRYTAHALAARVPTTVDYILDTWAPEQRHQLKREDILQWAAGSEWLGLEVLATHQGGADDQQGSVTFVARYRQGMQLHEHREHSLFRRDGEQWYFVQKP